MSLSSSSSSLLLLLLATIVLLLLLFLDLCPVLGFRKLQKQRQAGVTTNPSDHRAKLLIIIIIF